MQLGFYSPPASRQLVRSLYDTTFLNPCLQTQTSSGEGRGGKERKKERKKPYLSADLLNDLPNCTRYRAPKDNLTARRFISQKCVNKCWSSILRHPRTSGKTNGKQGNFENTSQFKKNAELLTSTPRRPTPSWHWPFTKVHCRTVGQTYTNILGKGKGKGKAIPLQGWTGPESSEGWGSQISRQSAHKGGKVVSPTHRPPLSPGNIPGTHFC